MSLITSPELFINIKKIPTADSREYKAFFKEEMRKIRTGVTVNGVFIPPWLYWHVNHWILEIDQPAHPITGHIARLQSKPDLRDNEWLIGESIYKAELAHEGLLVLGSRQLGKSEFGASYGARRAIAFKNTQNVIAGLSTYDLDLLTSKIDRGFSNIHPYFSPQLRILNDWKKKVVLGYKDRKGNSTVHSEIIIRNLDEGNNSEALAGPTTSSLLLDEIGKGKWLESFIAVRPTLETQYGWRCSPIFSGTSGSFDKSRDLQDFYNSLKTYNFRAIEIPEGNTTKKFIPGYMSSRVKRKKVRLSDYLGLPREGELSKTAIKVITSREEAINTIKGQVQDLLDAGKSTLAKKEQMYYPITEEDLFLVSDEDDVFGDIKEIAREHLAYLESIDQKEEYVWMVRDSVTGKVKAVPADKFKLPVFDFPLESPEKVDKDCPIVIYDHPIPGQEFGVLHVSGADPYNQDEAPTSPSLGSFYIFRRTYDVLRGVFQNRIVASYVARPDKIGRWRSQVELLMEYYQATCLPENEEPGFIRHFDNRFKAHWLEDGMDLAKEINPNTKVKRNKGLSASTANIRYGNGLLKEYCLEEITMGQTPDGENIIKNGIIRIPDKVLLREIIAYKPGMNVDRIVAFRHALIIARHKDKYFPIAKIAPQKQEHEKPKAKINPGPFSKVSRSPFTRRRSPF